MVIEAFKKQLEEKATGVRNIPHTKLFIIISRFATLFNRQKVSQLLEEHLASPNAEEELLLISCPRCKIEFNINQESSKTI